jgi:hypothetical protein
MGNWSVVGWYWTRNAEFLTRTQMRLILSAFDSYEAVRLWW